MRRVTTYALASGLLLGATAAPAVAGPESDVASAFDPDDGFDLHLSLGYELDIRRSAIRREAAGEPGASPTGPMPVERDLIFAGARHTLTPRLELGLFHDVSFGLALPYVLSDDRTLELDQRNTPCDFEGGDRTCVNRAGSSTLTDGILPMAGFDAQNGGAGFVGDDPTVFRGPTRSGVDQVHLGLTWAAMNQARDRSKPTWKLGAELRLAVGAIQRIDPAAPAANTAVGRGVDEVRLWTSAARRLGWAEPYFEAWWLAPIAVEDDSPFVDPGFGARNTTPQQQGGTRFGVEAYAVDQGEEGARLSLELSGRVVAHFEGRAHTEMWEVFAMAGNAATSGPLVLDADPTAMGLQALDHPGVSSVENYLEAGGRVAARIAVGQRFRVSASFEVTAETEHVITFGDAGVDLPACEGGAGRDCESVDDDLVTPGTAEVSPLHVQRIDLVGHRYRADDVFNYVLGAQAQFLF